MELPSEDASPFSFRSRLRALRRMHGFTVRELASRAGVSPALISSVETGKTNPSVSTISSICEGLGVEVADIFLPSSTRLRATSKDQREVLITAGGIQKSVLMREPERGVSLYEIVMPPDSETGLMRHPRGSIDLIVVGSGSISVLFSEMSFELKEGDNLRFCSDTGHSIANETQRPATFQWLALDVRTSPRAPLIEPSA